MDVIAETKGLYKEYGQSKPLVVDNNCFFLLRKFKGMIDLLIIFNTKSCRCRCNFCNLSNRQTNCKLSLLEQFMYVMHTMKHSLSIIDRVTLSNNGSILDKNAVELGDLCKIIEAVSQIRNISSIAIETDLRFITSDVMEELKRFGGKIKYDFITGYETSNQFILKNILGKNRDDVLFLRALDTISAYKYNLTGYILYKPSQDMTDDEAYEDAKESAQRLISECKERSIGLTLRINPMFAAKGTVWTKIAMESENYSPPKISQVFTLAKEVNQIVPTYVGLSTENKEEKWGSYRVHDDFTKDLLLEIIRFNTTM